MPEISRQDRQIAHSGRRSNRYVLKARSMSPGIIQNPTGHMCASQIERQQLFRVEIFNAFPPLRKFACFSRRPFPLSLGYARSDLGCRDDRQKQLRDGPVGLCRHHRATR